MQIGTTYIDLNASDIKKCKDIQDLKSLDIFSHLSCSECTKANECLWAELHPAKPMPDIKVTSENIIDKGKL